MKKEVLERVNEQIRTLEKQKEIIEKTDLYSSISQKDFRELCKSELRYSPLILEPIKATFPEAKNFEKGPNCIGFEYCGLTLDLSLIGSCNITIKTIGYHSEENLGQPKVMAETKYDKLFCAYNRKASIFELSKICYPHSKGLASRLVDWIAFGRKEYSFTRCEEQVKRNKDDYNRYLSQRKEKIKVELDFIARLEKALPSLADRWEGVCVISGFPTVSCSIEDFIKIKERIVDQNK